MSLPAIPPEKRDAEFEVRYSEKFSQGQRKQERKTGLLGAILILALAIDIAVHSWSAFRTHTWVDLGTRINHQVLYPPLVGALAVVLLLLLSGYLLWAHFLRK